MNQELSIFQLILHASFVVQAVMLLLLLVSVASWAAIFRKISALRAIERQNSQFENDFWSGAGLNNNVKQLCDNKRTDKNRNNNRSNCKKYC